MTRSDSYPLYVWVNVQFGQGFIDISHLTLLNVLMISRGFDDLRFKHKINPRCIEKPYGRVYRVKL